MSFYPRIVIVLAARKLAGSLPIPLSKSSGIGVYEDGHTLAGISLVFMVAQRMK